MKLVFRPQMYRRYVRRKRGKRVNIRISGQRHARIRLFMAQCEGELIVPTRTTEQ